MTLDSNSSGYGSICKWQRAFALRQSDSIMAGSKPQSSSAMVMKANGSVEEINNLCLQ